jgi:hypothetical protein
MSGGYLGGHTVITVPRIAQNMECRRRIEANRKALDRCPNSFQPAQAWSRKLVGGLQTVAAFFDQAAAAGFLVNVTGNGTGLQRSRFIFLPAPRDQQHRTARNPG